MKTINELKNIFSGPQQLLFSKAVADLSGSTLTITPDVELPVEVDTLKATMDDPTINHYKVIGQAGDWATTAELGDFNVEFVVPSKAEDLLKIAFGEDAIGTISKLTIAGTTDTNGIGATAGYKGVALEPKKFKVQGTIVIVDETKNNLMVITNIALYATLVWDDTGTKPVAFKFSGSIEGSGLKSVAWLTKNGDE